LFLSFLFLLHYAVDLNAMHRKFTRSGVYKFTHTHTHTHTHTLNKSKLLESWWVLLASQREHSVVSLYILQVYFLLLILITLQGGNACMSQNIHIMYTDPVKLLSVLFLLLLY
jgi:hypothetical protein